VDEVEFTAGRYPGEYRVRLREDHLVPPHVRDLQRFVPFIPEIPGKEPHAAGKDTEAGGVILLAAVKQHLQPHTNPQDRNSGFEALSEQEIQTQLPEIMHGFAGGPHAWKNDAFGGPDVLMGSGHLTRKAKEIQGSCHTGQIAGPIVQDRNHIQLLISRPFPKHAEACSW